MNIDSVTVMLRRGVSQQLCNWDTMAAWDFQHDSPPGNCLLTLPVCNAPLSLILTGSSQEVTQFNKISVCWAKDSTTILYPGRQNPCSVLWEELSSYLVSVFKVMGETNHPAVNHSLIVTFEHPFALTVIKLSDMKTLFGPYFSKVMLSTQHVSV